MTRKNVALPVDIIQQPLKLATEHQTEPQRISKYMHVATKFCFDSLFEVK